VHSIGTILLASKTWKWVLRLGGPGLILVGVIDNSVIPMPGGTDFFVILLSAHHRAWWVYYAVMGTLGALLGGYLTYRLSRKGGKEAFEKEIGKQKSEKVYQRFEKRGFSSVMVGAVLPPPFPMVPILMAAGALQYPRKKFMSALAIGRGVRFFALAFLGRTFGTAIIGWLGRYYKPLLYALIAAGLLAGVGVLVYVKWYRPRKQRQKDHAPQDDSQKRTDSQDRPNAA
jgi:membrane protein YqaA with SNARE-associated domain